MSTIELDPKKITVIIGPTASGKSDLAIKLATQTGAHIISADAFQVYKGMDIGTAKVSQTILEKVPHHLINIKSPTDVYSAGEFVKLASHCINQLQSKQIPAIICGGTAMYMKAFLHQFNFPIVPPDTTIRDKWSAFIQKNGHNQAWQQLHKLDPVTANQIDNNNTHRLIRALEIIELTGQPVSTQRTQTNAQREDVTIIGLAADRQLIIQRINNRVDKMIEQGLVAEVESLLKTTPPKSKSLQAIGYKQVIDYLDGQMEFDEMVELIKVKTRQFAKQQMTWYKRFTHVQWQNISK